MLQIITDSASDITLKQAENMKIHIVPLSIRFPDGECPQEKDEDFLTFYRRLQEAEELPVTSQPSPEAYLTYYREAEKNGDDVLVLTLSSGLSGTINAAKIAKEICEYDRVFVVDTRQAILSQRIVVEYAVKLRDEGLKTEEIVENIEELRDRVVVCGVVDTLTYLKKGGRIPKSLAVLGNALQIKPVIILEDKILKTIGKVRGRKAGKKCLHQKFEESENDVDFPIYFGYTSDKEIVEEFMQETIEKYGLEAGRTKMYPVGGVIGTHVSTDCIAVAYVKKSSEK